MGIAVEHTGSHNCNNIQTDDKTTCKKPNFGIAFTSTAAGLLAGEAMRTIIKPHSYIPKKIDKFSFSNIFHKEYRHFLQKMDNYDTTNGNQITNAINKMYNQSFDMLSKKNIHVYDYANGVPSGAKENLFKNIKIKIGPISYKKSENPLLKSMRDVASSRTAFSHLGDVHINMKGTRRFTLPHEIGHSLNYKSKGLSKIIQSIGNKPRLLVPLIFATAIFRQKKAEGEKSESFVGKSLDFVKNNCVGLTASCFVPLLIEEASASIKGIKMMKNLLSPKQLSILKWRYGLAWGTYFVHAVAAVGAVWAANKVKNLINKPQKIELAEQKDAATNTNDKNHDEGSVDVLG